MIRFIDLNTGNVFSGGSPYVFWFDGEQSTELVYTKAICILCDYDKISIKMPNNEVFKLLKLQSNNSDSFKNENIDGITYKDIQQLYSDLSIDNEKTEYQYLNLTGYQYANKFIYIFYVAATASLGGEYKEDFEIRKYRDFNNPTNKEELDEHVYGEYAIGADFYEENELHYINLSNFGVEIPDAIQKAIYVSNVHEDKKDNILMNRKWKELLSNYWDVIANKGSYKSLYNALKWFEYGDKLNLYEIWKHDTEHGVQYEERNIQEVLSEKYFETLNGFAKTTYIAISYALEKIKKENNITVYDSEKNPQLEYIVDKWSITDLSLKLSLLGNFYKTYFMPIHLNCIRSTIEDVVYSNTIKLIQSSHSSRLDMVGNNPDCECNIKDGAIFPLQYVSARVGQNTLFANKYTELNPHTSIVTDYNNIDIVGVQPVEPDFDIQDEEIPDEDLKTYFSQRYNDIGAIIKFQITMYTDTKDMVKREMISIIGDKSKKWNTITNHKIFNFKKAGDKYKVEIPFYILCTKEQQYEVRLLFETAGGSIYTKNVKFNVIDTRNTSIKVYKISHNKKLKLKDRHNTPINDYVFGRMGHVRVEDNWFKNPYKQFIPALMDNPNKSIYKDYKGICLNHFMILKCGLYGEEYDPLNNDYIKTYYHMWPITKQDENKNDIKYVLCLSKTFGFIPDRNELSMYRGTVGGIYKEQYVFYPDFHHLTELTGDNLEDYIITDEDAVCVIPDITFSKWIEDYQWEFINTSTLNNKSIIPPLDIKEPFVAESVEKTLDSGYYDIIFRYKLIDNDKYNTITLKSAFLKK